MSRVSFTARKRCPWCRKHVLRTRAADSPRAGNGVRVIEECSNREGCGWHGPLGFVDLKLRQPDGRITRFRLWDGGADYPLWSEILR